MIGKDTGDSPSALCGALASRLPGHVPMASPGPLRLPRHEPMASQGRSSPSERLLFLSSRPVHLLGHYTPVLV